MPLLLLREIILIAALAASSYTDLRTGLINDWITYPLIVAGIALNLVDFNFGYFLIAAAVFAVGYAVYWLGKLGGGDVKLFTGIALTMPILSGHVFVVALAVYSAITAIVFLSVFYVAKYARIGIDWKENRQCVTRALLLGIALLAYFYYITSTAAIPLLLIQLLSVAMFFALLFLAFEKGIKRNFFLKQVKLDELEEDEIIASEFLDEETKKKLGVKFKGVLGGKEVEKLKKYGTSEILVYRGLPPFAPFILIAALLVLLKPELVEFFVI